MYVSSTRDVCTICAPTMYDLCTQGQVGAEVGRVGRGQAESPGEPRSDGGGDHEKISTLGACEIPGSQPATFNVRCWCVSKIAPKRYGDTLETKTELTATVVGPLHAGTLRHGLLMKPETLAQLQENQIEVLMTAIRYHHPAANWPLQSHTQYLRLCTITGDDGAEYCLYACPAEVLSVQRGLIPVPVQIDLMI
jgi:hypothetical protein